MFSSKIKLSWVCYFMNKETKSCKNHQRMYRKYLISKVIFKALKKYSSRYTIPLWLLPSGGGGAGDPADEPHLPLHREVRLVRLRHRRQDQRSAHRAHQRADLQGEGNRALGPVRRGIAVLYLVDTLISYLKGTGSRDGIQIFWQKLVVLGLTKSFCWFLDF